MHRTITQVTVDVAEMAVCTFSLFLFVFLTWQAGVNIYAGEVAFLDSLAYVYAQLLSVDDPLVWARNHSISVLVMFLIPILIQIGFIYLSIRRDELKVSDGFIVALPVVVIFFLPVYIMWFLGLTGLTSPVSPAYLMWLWPVLTILFAIALRGVGDTKMLV